MNSINLLVKFPITYTADGECKLLDAFPVTPKEMMKNKLPSYKEFIEEFAKAIDDYK